MSTISPFIPFLPPTATMDTWCPTWCPVRHNRRGRSFRYRRADAYFPSSSSSFRFLAETPSASSMRFLFTACPLRRTCRHAEDTSSPPRFCAVSSGNLLAGDQRDLVAVGQRRARTGRGHRQRRRAGPRPHGPRQPAPGGQHCPRLHRQGARTSRPDRRGKPGLAARSKASTRPSARDSRPMPVIGSSNRSSGL